MKLCETVDYTEIRRGDTEFLWQHHLLLRPTIRLRAHLVTAFPFVFSDLRIVERGKEYFIDHANSIGELGLIF